MKKKKTILIKLLLMFFVMSCKSENVNSEATDIVFKHANVITMSSNKVLKNKSVYVSNGIIKEIGDFKDLNLPEGTAVIKSRGKYLTPGFSDMHTHIYEKEELSLFLANGVTTIRNMWGFPEHLEERDKIRRGELLGPDIFTTGPLTDGNNPYWEGSYILTDPDKVEDYVIKIKEDGYDFIKVYERLSPKVFSKIMEVANKHGIPVVGHVPQRVDLNSAINQKMTSIEHFRGYWLEYNLVKDLEEEINLTVESGIWNCPTLIVKKTYTDHSKKFSKSKKKPKKDLPELKYVSPETFEYWDNIIGFNCFLESAKQLLKVLSDKGANIVSGTDQGPGGVYVVAGFSLHDEFELMNQAGLTPYEVLLTTTVNPANMLGIEDKAGTIEVGKYADLVLLEENPLEDIKNTRSISGVMVKGKWLNKKVLDNMLDEVEKSYSKE